MPSDLRARMSFIHHRTYSNAHPDYGKVQGLMGSAKAQSGNGQEMISSLFAQENAAPLTTIQSEPVPLGGVGEALPCSFTIRRQPLPRPHAGRP